MTAVTVNTNTATTSAMSSATITTASTSTTTAASSSTTAASGSADNRVTGSATGGHLRRGRMGMKLAAGEQVLTTSGRVTTPFPRIDLSTTQRASATLRRVDAWLLANARAEAEARDTAVVWRFGLDVAEVGNLSPADKDTFEMILFELEFWRD